MAYYGIAGLHLLAKKPKSSVLCKGCFDSAPGNLSCFFYCQILNWCFLVTWVCVQPFLKHSTLFSVRIGGGMYVAELQEVAARVHKLADWQQREDELLAEVPDDFLDPIMSTLMTDPVILPSSRQVVDRSTIARSVD